MRDTLLVDLFHRAIRRLYEGEGAAVPVAPTVHVVNLSIGDAYRLFSRKMSPWARLLDWLSWKYGLPPSLSGTREWRRLTITLAWITPVVPSRRAYRAVRLNVTVPTDTLKLGREDASHVAVDRGTVQHEVFEGVKAVAFVDGNELVFPVECRGAADEPAEPVAYGLCVSLEVAQGVQIPIYNEIRARIQPAVQVAA